MVFSVNKIINKIYSCIQKYDIICLVNDNSFGTSFFLYYTLSYIVKSLKKLYNRQDEVGIYEFI